MNRSGLLILFAVELPRQTVKIPSLVNFSFLVEIWIRQTLPEVRQLARIRRPSLEGGHTFSPQSRTG